MDSRASGRTESPGPARAGRRAGGRGGARLRPDAATTPRAVSPAPAVGAPRAAAGSAPRARGMRAADSGTWERVRQLAAQGEPAPSCGAGAGPARPPGPAVCEPSADAAGSSDRPRAGAPSARADGDYSQPGRCAPRREGAAAAGRGAPGRARGGAPDRDPAAAGGKVLAAPGAPSAGRGEGGDARDAELVLSLGFSGLGGFPAEPRRELPREVKATGAVRSRGAGRPGSDPVPVLGSVGMGPSSR